MDLGSVTGSVALQSTEYARSTLAYLFTSTPLKNFAKSTVLSTFGKIRKGCLVIQHPNGEKLVLGEDKETSASLIVHNDYFWIRVFLSADIVSQVSVVVKSIWGSHFNRALPSLSCWEK